MTEFREIETGKNACVTRMISGLGKPDIDDIGLRVGKFSTNVPDYHRQTLFAAGTPHCSENQSIFPLAILIFGGTRGKFSFENQSASIISE